MSNFDSNTANNCSILDAFTYLDIQSEKFSGHTLSEIIKDIIPNNKEYKHLVKSNNYYKILLDACNDDNSNVGKMRLVSQSHIDFKDQFSYSGKSCTDDPIQSCAFESDTGDLYVAYRGTGNSRWGDNGQGYTAPTTDMQETAKEYFDYVVKNRKNNGFKGNLYITGHSKGGNEAQYATMTSDYRNEITACYSLEGQGFSKEADKQFRNNNSNYEELRNKIYSINGQDDPVHQQGSVILAPEENTYYVNSKTFHGVHGIIKGAEINWQRDENGKIIHGKYSWGTKAGKIFNENISSLPDVLKGPCAIAIMEIVDMFRGGGSMDDADAGLRDFKILNSIGIPLILFSLSEISVAYFYEKYGVIGGIAAAFFTTIISIAISSIVTKLFQITEAVYISRKIIDSVVDIVNEAKKICEKAGDWANQIISNISMLINNFERWLFHHSAGYQYAQSNPYIEINTTTMSVHAKRLRSLSSRTKSLDSRMNSLYVHAGVDWNTILALKNLGKLLKVGLKLDYTCRLNDCANYLEYTVNQFDKAESDICNSF